MWHLTLYLVIQMLTSLTKQRRITMLFALDINKKMQRFKKYRIRKPILLKCQEEVRAE